MMMESTFILKACQILTQRLSDHLSAEACLYWKYNLSHHRLCVNLWDVLDTTCWPQTIHQYTLCDRCRDRADVRSCPPEACHPGIWSTHHSPGTKHPHYNWVWVWRNTSVNECLFHQSTQTLCTQDSEILRTAGEVTDAQVKIRSAELSVRLSQLSGRCSG